MGGARLTLTLTLTQTLTLILTLTLTLTLTLILTLTLTLTLALTRRALRPHYDRLLIPMALYALTPQPYRSTAKVPPRHWSECPLGIGQSAP